MNASRRSAPRELFLSIALMLPLAPMLPSCSFVAATRAPSPETGEACSNFVDDDLDGTADCDDLECDGVCPEETLDACSDGRDNDGDGVIDRRDARCWHLVPPTVTRCATVQGSRIAPPIDDRALVWRGVAETVPSPDDPSRSVFAAPDRAFRLSPVASSTGALDGLRVSARLRLTNTIETSLALVPAGELGDATTAAVFTRVVRLVLGRFNYLEADGMRGATLVSPDHLAEPTWVDVELVIHGRTVVATLGFGTGDRISLPTIEVPAALVDPVALDVLVQGEEPGSLAAPLLSSLVIERAPLPACGRDELVPEFRAGGIDLVLAVAHGGPDGTTRCAISLENGAGTPHVARGDGDWTAARETIGFDDVIGAAMDWDESRAAFVGLAARGPDRVGGANPWSFDRITSSDCVTFTTSPSMLPMLDPSTELSSRGMSYVIEEDGRHVVRLLARRAEELGIVAFASEDGEGGELELSEPLRALGPEASSLAGEGANLGIELVGRTDIVLIAAASQGIVALTPRGGAGRFEELPEPLLPLSDVAGTFDRGLVVGPPRLLTSSDPDLSRIFYGGTSFGNCFACLTSGSALFTTGEAP